MSGAMGKEQAQREVLASNESQLVPMFEVGKSTLTSDDDALTERVSSSTGEKPDEDPETTVRALLEERPVFLLGDPQVLVRPLAVRNPDHKAHARFVRPT